MARLHQIENYKQIVRNICRIKPALYVMCFMAVTACTTNQQEKEKPQPLFRQPKTVPLNITNGYTTNQLTGDTIIPVINASFDTIKTGIPIPAAGKSMHSDSISYPDVVKAPRLDKLIKKAAHPNIKKLTIESTMVCINKDSLKHIPITQITETDTSNYMLNRHGKRTPTGVPIGVKGRVVNCKQPKPYKALAPGRKYDAIEDLHYLNTDQGMNQTHIFSVLEDTNGALWFGTYGGGVIKYNGTHFTCYTEKEGMSSNKVLSILEDKKGNLWFGTNGGGVTKYNGNSFVHYTATEGLISNSIRTIFEDKNGNLWFGSLHGGVTKFDGNNFIHYTEKEGLSKNRVKSIIEDRNGNFWFGTDGGGVTKFDGINFTQYTKKDGLSSNIINSIVEDRNGSIWFGTYWGGVSKFDGDCFTHYTKKEGLSHDNICSILEDKNGNLWFGTYGGGVTKFNGSHFTHLTEKEGLINNNVFSIFEDKGGNIWFGTGGGGVAKYNRNNFVHFKEKEGLGHNSIWSTHEDKSGNLWFGTNGGGVTKYDGSNFIHYKKIEFIGRVIIPIIEDEIGNLWFGTYGAGIVKFDKNSFTRYTEKQGLSNNKILSILQDRSGNLWFGTDGGGVTKFDGKNFIHFTEKEGLSNNSVWSILEDKNGNIWLGTNGGGVTKFDGSSFIHYTEKEGLSSNQVLSIIEDKNGDLWFGTHGKGITIFNGETFTYYSKKEGLTSNAVCSIVEDKIGNIYIATDRGITVLTPSRINEPITGQSVEGKRVEFTTQSFDEQNGLSGLSFLNNSAYIDSKNRAWWGSGKGLEMLDLKKITPPNDIPKPYLRQLDINEHFIDYRSLRDSSLNYISFDSVAKFENYPLNLELAHHQNHITFHFSAINWKAPHKTKYSYRLKSLNKNWSQPKSELKAEYRNLPYGSHTFQVVAIGETHIWSEPFNYSFTIFPPFWKTWWAYAIYGFLLIGSITLFIKWRERNLEMQKKLLEQTVEERTSELVQQKTIIEEKHREITDSINYAERIQHSFLASTEMLDKHLKDYFVFFRPKDVVSGDFYWAGELKNGDFAFSCADSTGHGVPGAIMSILNISSLEKSIEKETSPDQILNKTREIIIDRLKKDGSSEGGKDGMDCSLLVLEKNRKKLLFSAANNPVLIARPSNPDILKVPTNNDTNNLTYELLEFKPDKIPVGKHEKDSEPFTLHTFTLNKGDIIYAITDGFQDQFGGPKGKKFLVKNLKNLLVSIAGLPMCEQREELDKVFTEWKKNEEQVDDVCVIGVRI